MNCDCPICRPPSRLTTRRLLLALNLIIWSATARVLYGTWGS